MAGENLFTLKGAFMAVACCAAVHVGFGLFGVEALFHNIPPLLDVSNLIPGMDGLASCTHP